MQIIVKLAECVALWGEPEEAVHGIKERAAVSSGMKGIRETIWLVIAFELRTYVARVGGRCARGVYSHLPVPQKFASFPGPKTGQGYYSAVPTSPSLFCTGMVENLFTQVGVRKSRVATNYIRVSILTRSCS